MIVLSFPAETAEKIVNGEQTVVTYPAAHSEWVVRLVCCGRHDGCYRAASWDDADTFRRSYIEAEGHDRQGIIESLVGQPVAVARLPERNDFFTLVTKAGLCRHCGKGPDPDGDHSCPCPHPDDTCPDHPPPVRGAIVGSATIAAVQQRVGEDRGQVGWAVILTDAAPCEQRCPWCRGTGIGDLLDRTYCEQCHGSQMAWPIPYDHPGPISEWSPK